MFQKREERKSFYVRHPLFVGSTTLIGGIVGAGVLGIPYTIAKAGFLYGLLLLIGLGLAFLLINLFLGEIILRTKGNHQLTGYAAKYLGPWGRLVLTCTMAINVYGALIAYLIGSGAALAHIFPVGSSLLFTLLFFALGTTIVIFGLKATGNTESVLVGMVFLIVIVLGIFSLQDINPVHFETFHPAFFFLPYGVILFAYHGLLVVPEAAQELTAHKRLLRRTIIIGSVVPIILYVLFAAIVVGLVGPGNFSLLQPDERIATVALSLYAQPFLALLVNILAVCAMFTSYLTLGTALFEMYHIDYKVSKALSLLLTFSVPLIIVLLSLTTFIGILGFVGALVGGIDSITIILMYWRAKKFGQRKPEYSLGKHYALGGLCIILFLLGIGYFLFV